MKGFFLDLPSIGILLGITHSFFLAIFLLSIRKENTHSQKFLSALLIAMAVGMGGSILYQGKAFSANPALGKLLPTNEFLYGPLFYFYIKSMLQQEFKWRLKECYHFVPALIFLLLTITPEKSINSFIWREEGSFLKKLISLHVLVYLYLSKRNWIRYKISLQDYFSSIEKIRMNWVRNLIIGMFLVFLISLLPTFLVTPENLKLAPLACSIFIYATAYRGMRQNQMFVTVYEKNQQELWKEELKRKSKYQNSGLDQKRKAEIEEKMTKLMMEEKIFKESNLTLSGLAERLSATTHHLSQVLNESKGKTFFEFVNEFRVKEVQELMKDQKYKNYTLLGLALEAGFNSKSAFNIAFKKYTKLTPLQYRNSAERKK